MKKILLTFLMFMLTATITFAAKLPDNIKDFVKSSYPNADIRFDGVIILPDNTIYLPLYPAKILKTQKASVKNTYPANMSFSQKPDVIIFSDDFVLLKVLVQKDGTKTVKKFDKVPTEIKTGLLPQDMLVPKNFIIPENLKGILGALSIKIQPDEEIKVAATQLEYNKTKVSKPTKNILSSVPQLKNKMLYIATTYTKDIQVVEGENTEASYALSQKSIPRSMAITPDNKFLLVTTYNSTLVDVISLADDRIIKQLDLTSNAGEIITDYKNKTAYVTAPDISTIYQISMTDMTLKKKFKVNGWCEKLFLANNYLMYVDKLTDRIWSVELNNDYVLKDMGSYPNIAKIAFHNGYVFAISRTKNRFAVIDYQNQTLFTEYETVKKPVDMISYGASLFILGAQDNNIHVISKDSWEPVATIKLTTSGFPKGFVMIPNSQYAVIYDSKAGKYSVVDLYKKVVVKTNNLDIPVYQMIIGKQIRKM